MSVIGHVKSVHKFLSDVKEAVKDTPWPKSIAESLPWWGGAVGEALADSFGPIKFILELYKSTTIINDPNELGYLACTLAFVRSAQQALTQLPGTAKDIIDDADDLLEPAPTGAYDFTSFAYETAKTHAFYIESREVLGRFCRLVGLSDADINRVTHQVDIRFVTNLQLILTNRETEEKFGPFLALIGQSKPDRSDLALTRHAAYQRWLYEERPILGEPFALQHVYVDTECGDLTWAEFEEGRKRRPTDRPPFDPFNEHCGGRHGLLQRVLDLIGDPSFKDAIVIQGYAGSGKSSLTLRLCQALLDEGLQPIRIELKALDTRSTKDIAETLPAAVRLGDSVFDPNAGRYDEPSGLFRDDKIFDQTARFRGATISKYVLILDAWDEISVGAALGYQEQVSKLLERVRDLYLRPRVRSHSVRVILTGRPTEAVAQARFLHDETRLLTVRPFNPDALSTFHEKIVRHLRTKPILIPGWYPWNLDGKQGLSEVFKLYEAEFKRAVADEKKPVVGDRTKKHTSIEILGLPLLAHLAFRLIAAWPGDVKQILENTTLLYRSLVDLIIGGGGKPRETRGETEAAPHLRNDHLRQLLRGTATAITLVGSEAITKKELSLRLDLEPDELERRASELDDSEVLARLMISFFFKGGFEELGCEFSHKSFREYLFAEEIIETLKTFGRGTEPFQERDLASYWKDFDERDDPRFSWSRKLADLLGPQWITPEVSHYVTQLIEWEISRSWGLGQTPAVGDSTMPLEHRDSWYRVRDGLADLWDWWGEGGTPASPTFLRVEDENSGVLTGTLGFGGS